MSRATVYLDVAGGKRLPVWAERRIRTRAQAEADWIARELERPVALVAHVSMDARGRVFAGIADHLFRVTMHGLEPLRARPHPGGTP